MPKSSRSVYTEPTDDFKIQKPMEVKVNTFLTVIFFLINRSLRSNEIKLLEEGMFSQRSNLTYL